VIAAYHDLGRLIDNETHHLESAKMLRADKTLREFFSDDEIEVMAEAVEDHRASLGHEPRNVYGKIVSSADRRTDMIDVLKTMYTYNLKNNSNFTLEENVENAYEHICRKFARGGYARAKMYFKDEEYEQMLDEADYYAHNKQQFVKRYLEINNVDVKNL